VKRRRKKKLLKKRKKQKAREQIKALSKNSELPERDSLIDTYDRLQNIEHRLLIEELFSYSSSKKQLLLASASPGRAGIGKALSAKNCSDWALEDYGRSSIRLFIGLKNS